MPPLPRYYENENTFSRIHHTLKQYPCPHCGVTGFLILHGLLFGYFDLAPQAFLQRGHRVFCSNRHRRRGCGRTASLILASCLKGFIIGTLSFWRFLSRLGGRRRFAQAFRKTGVPFAPAAPYRLWKRFLFEQSALRTSLVRRSPSPERGKDPSAQTIRHLRRAFPRSRDPIAAFQLHFQTGFFG